MQHLTLEQICHSIHERTQKLVDIWQPVLRSVEEMGSDVIFPSLAYYCCMCLFQQNSKRSCCFLLQGIFDLLVLTLIFIYLFIFTVVVKTDRNCFPVRHLVHCIDVIHDTLVQRGGGRDRGLLFAFSFCCLEKQKIIKKELKEEPAIPVHILSLKA